MHDDELVCIDEPPVPPSEKDREIRRKQQERKRRQEREEREEVRSRVALIERQMSIFRREDR